MKVFYYVFMLNPVFLRINLMIDSVTKIVSITDDQQKLIEAVLSRFAIIIVYFLNFLGRMIVMQSKLNVKVS